MFPLSLSGKTPTSLDRRQTEKHAITAYILILYNTSTVDPDNMSVRGKYAGREGIFMSTSQSPGDDSPAE